MDAASRQTRESMIRELIAARAYEMWESQGRSHGRDKLHWLQAEQEIMSSLERDVGSSAPGDTRDARRPAAVPKPIQPAKRRMQGKAQRVK